MSPEETDKTRVSGEAVNDPEELRREIEQDREALGDTVEALADKADVKARVKGAVDERKEQFQEQPIPVAAVAGGLAAAVVLLLLLRRKRS